jgi:hypothetical protein
VRRLDTSVERHDGRAMSGGHGGVGVLSLIEITEVLLDVGRNLSFRQEFPESDYGGQTAVASSFHSIRFRRRLSRSIKLRFCRLVFARKNLFNGTHSSRVPELFLRRPEIG